MKTKLNNCDLIKLINKMKKQLTNWKKIFANDTTNKELIFKYTNNIYSSM